jgi:hypothetical protein
MSTPNRPTAKPEASPNQDEPAQSKSSEVDLREAMRRRAEEIYEKSGRIPGRDLHNWALAEAQIRYGNRHSLRPQTRGGRQCGRRAVCRGIRFRSGLRLHSR